MRNPFSKKKTEDKKPTAKQTVKNVIEELERKGREAEEKARRIFEHAESCGA